LKENLKKEITVFITYFNKQLNEIEELKTLSVVEDEKVFCHPEIFQQLLYVSVLDTLARSVKSNQRENKKRFVSFVRRFCQWQDGERVSLPHLAQFLKKNPDPAFQELRDWVFKKYKAMPVHNSKFMLISDDPAYKDVERLWPVDKKNNAPIEKIQLDSLNHFHLLYAHRNTLVHELRAPGYGMNFANMEVPHYHGRSIKGDEDAVSAKGDEDAVSAELVYPRKFLHHLCQTALQNLEKYFLTNKLNPYDSFKFGTYWIQELNS